MIFQQKLLEEAYCFVKMTGPAMVRPVGSDFWKAPLVFQHNKVVKSRSDLPKNNFIQFQSPSGYLILEYPF